MKFYKKPSLSLSYPSLFHIKKPARFMFIIIGISGCNVSQPSLRTWITRGLLRVYCFLLSWYYLNIWKEKCCGLTKQYIKQSIWHFSPNQALNYPGFLLESPLLQFLIHRNYFTSLLTASSHLFLGLFSPHKSWIHNLFLYSLVLHCLSITL